MINLKVYSKQPTYYIRKRTSSSVIRKQFFFKDLSTFTFQIWGSTYKRHVNRFIIVFRYMIHLICRIHFSQVYWFRLHSNWYGTFICRFFLSICLICWRFFLLIWWFLIICLIYWWCFPLLWWFFTCLLFNWL